MDQFLIGFALLVVWLGSLYAHPFGRCPRCRGKRMITRPSGGKRRPRPKQCWLCKGIGRRQRPGSKTVHRAVRYLRAYYRRTRRES